MEIETDSETIQYLWEALQNSPRHPRYHQAEHNFREEMKRGWIFASDLEDILILMDNRLDSHRFRIRHFCEPMDIRFEEAFYRPKLIGTAASSFEALRPEYFVLLLIQLERMGFQIDAQRFVNILLPSVKARSKKIFSVAELEIFWYGKSRLKQADVIVYCDRSRRYDFPDRKIKLHSGFKLSLGQEEGEEPHLLTIRAPKYRERPRPKDVTCPECGYEWRKGDAESSYYHRREHCKRMAWLSPHALQEMVAELAEKGIGAELVLWDSPSWKQREMYNRALAFRREFHYDFVQWGENMDGELDAHGYLFTNERSEIVGACSFRDRSENGIQRWGLQWVWICPKERRSGHLSKRWQALREQFGDFVVESPVSDAMQAFLEKRGEAFLMHYER